MGQWSDGTAKGNQINIMSIHVLIAHAEGEENLAEQLASPIREAGYDVAHRGTVMIGESFSEEATKLLNAGGPIVLCGTVKALGTGWAHHLINAAQRHKGIRVFSVQMEKDCYVQALSLDTTIGLYWQDPAIAIEALIASLKKYYPLQADTTNVLISNDLEQRYRELALKSYDIIDLANLPEDDRHLATRQIEIRRLYLALRVRVETTSGTEINEEVIEQIEKRRKDVHRRASTHGSAANDDRSRGVPIGNRLAEVKRLVILGDPGAGKTTMLRWLATAYLLRLNQDADWKGLPDVATLPNEDWLPVMIRCRDLDPSCFNGSVEVLLRHTLRKAEIEEAEVTALQNILLEKLKIGRALLLVDGLDEIPDISLRIRLSQQLEQIQLAYSDAPILVTSRIVGYREMGYRIKRGFEHVTVADLSKGDKDDFARRWCAITEVPERREAATLELIDDIHSTDRIERLTGNPMLLTTMALVKRKIGRLPSRRADLYWNALEVLLNWRREVDEPINDHEAIPQLEYLAYEMCDRGVPQLREDEIINLLDRMREEYPQVHAVREHSSEDFLRLLERRTGILIEAGYVRYNGRPIPTFEFRHLTFQEYLGGLALVDGKFPNRDRSKSLAENVAPLAAKIGDGEDTKQENWGGNEILVTENWREAIRLCVGSCNDDDVDDTLLSILNPLEGEDVYLTSRPRTILATLCLADEPNASEEVVRTVLESFVAQIVEADTASDSSNFAAAKELSISRWTELLCELLIEEFFKRDFDTRIELGNLYGMVATTLVIQNESLIPNWLNAQLVLLSAVEDKNKVRAALALAYLSFKAKAYVVPGTIDALQLMLSGRAPVAHAAADALRWLNDDTLENRTWHPSRVDLEGFSAIVSDPSSDPKTVQNLIRIIGHEGYADALDILITRMRNEIGFIRSAAARALGEIKSVRAIKPLIVAIKDSSATVRASATRALGKIADPIAIEPLISMLNDVDTNVQASAASALGEIGDPRAVDHLIVKLEQGTVPVQLASSIALGSLKDLRAVEPLITSFDSTLNDNALSLRFSTATALSEIGGERAIRALVGKLDSEDYLIRSFAATGIGISLSQPNSGIVIDLLREKLNESDSTSRAALVGELGHMEYASAIGELLTSFLPDESVAVREATRAALSSQAIKAFLSGNVESAADFFRSAVLVVGVSEPDDDLRNNFAYVLIIREQYDEASAQFAAMNWSRHDLDWPLYKHNQGLLAFLTGDASTGIVYLREALDWIRDAGFGYDPREAICMLVIEGEVTTSNQDLPIDAAILVNLYKMGDLAEKDLRTELLFRYPKEFEVWMEKFTTDRETS